MLIGFLDKFDNADQLIGKYVKAGQLDAAYQLAHGLKGVAGNISANGLFQSARDLCDALQTKKTEQLQPVSESFLRRFAKVITAIKDLPLETQPQRLSPEQIEQADHDVAIAILRELLQLIEAKDFEMVDLFQVLKKTLLDTRFSDRLNVLDKAIYQMDFEKSISVVSELIEEFEEQSE
jgi:HPt (histidine-containing phosphotransfer) domain-containing protein